jgi:hypothetical protein
LLELRAAVGLKLILKVVAESRCVSRCRVKSAVFAAVLLGASPIAAAPPQPIPIPQELSPPQEAYAAFPEATPANSATATPAPPSACELQLSKLATFKPLPTLVGPGECGATDAVLLDAVILPDQNKVTVSPPATLRCPMAEQIAQWVRDDVAPSVLKFGSPLRGLDNFDSYECRGRNRVRGAQLSEHGKADALDVRLFKLADGQSLTLTDVNVNKDWREAIKASVCARFSTILGPGSDGSHEEHIHLDLAQRRNNNSYCHWDVRTPAPPPVAQAKSRDAASAVASVAPQAGNAAAESEDEEAAAPLDTVPLPRPRPVAANLAAGGSARSRN